MASSRTEASAVFRLAGEASDRFLTTTAQDVHAAVADRAFGLFGRAAMPVRVVHDGISTAVYASVRAGVTAATRAAGVVAAQTGADPEVISRDPRGARVIAAANALIGHDLACDDDPLAIHMGLWHEDRPYEPRDIADALPETTDKIVLFVHGLGETEHAWTLFSDPDPSGATDDRGRPLRTPRTGYGELLRERSGWTPLFVRVNTGLPIAENGLRLSWLLQDLLDAWPVDVTQIALVGHSMGGLIARAAGQVATEQDAPWRRRLTHIACLGTPHQGAPLEQGVHQLAGLLNKLPESAPFGRLLDSRSAGIRDLRQGIDAGPLLDDVRHLFVGATITADKAHPIGIAFGDLLVGSASAAGPVDFELDPDDTPHLGGLNHFHLLNHPRVFELIEAHLAKSAPKPARRLLPQQTSRP